jgi:hypothetical protein
MNSVPLLTSSSLTSHRSRLSLNDIRLGLVSLVEDGKLAKAMKVFRMLLDIDPLVKREEAIKKCLLRYVWSKIEKHEEAGFGHWWAGAGEFLNDASDREWEETEQNGILNAAIESMQVDAQVQRQRDIAFGRCTHMVETMCRKEGVLIEEWLLEIEKTLA